MINAAIKTKVGITPVKNDKIVIALQTDEITRLSSFSDLPLKKRPSRHPVKVFNKASVRERSLLSFIVVWSQVQIGWVQSEPQDLLELRLQHFPQRLLLHLVQ